MSFSENRYPLFRDMRDGGVVGLFREPGGLAIKNAMSRGTDLLLSLLLSVVSLALCLLAAEAALRFLPVSTGLRSLPVTAADPVLHYTPNMPFTNSLGWDLHNVVHGRVNNAGFV